MQMSSNHHKQMPTFGMLINCFYSLLSISAKVLLVALKNALIWSMGPISIKNRIRDPKQEPEDSLVQSMILLGFEQEESHYALQLTGNDFEKAVNLLLNIGNMREKMAK